MSVMTVDTSARGLIETWLANYGLQGLGQWAWDLFLGGASSDEIMLKVRGTTDYKNRFPGMEELAKQGRAISESTYIDYENTVKSLLSQYGIPKGMYDTPADIANLMVRNVAPTEVNSRLQLAAAAAYTAPQEVRDALVLDYDVHAGDIIGFYLDADRALPILQQQYQAAQITGAAMQQQVATDRALAERLAAQGVTYDQARQGFGNVAATRALGSGFGETAAEQQRIAAQFGDTAAQQATERVQKGRLAQFQQGGGPSEAQSGVTGLGAASTR